MAPDIQELHAWLVILKGKHVHKEWGAGKEVACHGGLLKWGKATVVELLDSTRARWRYLCVGGIWRRMENLSGYIQWSPTRVGGPELSLSLSRQDEPAEDPDVPRLLWFRGPLVEDSSHTHMFIFESAEAAAIAAGMLFSKE